MNASALKLRHTTTILAGQSPDSSDVVPLGIGLPFVQGNAEFGAMHPVPTLESESATRVAEPGDVLISVRAPVGAVNVARERIGIGRGLNAVRAIKIDRFYLRWLLISSAESLNAVAVGSTYSAITPEEIRAINVPVSGVEEQRQIAAYLDQETGQIDELIAKQEQLLTTLAERRRVVVASAVSVGIDGAARDPHSRPFVSSAPEHWTVAPLKRFATFFAGAGFPHEYQGVLDEELPFLKVNALAKADKDGVLRWRGDSISRATAAMLGATVVPRGSVVIAKIGAALLLGRTRLLAEPACIDNNLMAAAPRRNATARYLYYVMSTIRFDWLVNPGAVPSTSEGAVGRFVLAFPPVEEQRRITDHLDEQTAAIDTLSTKATQMISLLRERRQALISAAVTGKIDVRSV